MNEPKINGNGNIDFELSDHDTLGNMYAALIEARAFNIRTDDRRITDEDALNIARHGMTRINRHSGMPYRAFKGIAEMLREKGYVIGATNTEDIEYNKRLLCEIKYFTQGLLTNFWQTMQRKSPVESEYAFDLLRRLEFYSQEGRPCHQLTMIPRNSPARGAPARGGKQRKTGKRRKSRKQRKSRKH
jgi:hypothetical protein